MINGIGSSYSSYYSNSGGNRSTANTTVEAARNEDNPLKNLFKILDSDGNGSISEAKLTAADKETDVQEEIADTIDVDQLLSLLDQNSDKALTEGELVSAFTLSSPPVYASSALADDLIVNLDSDGSDTLSTSELEALSELSGTTLLSALDRDESGEVDRDELNEALQAALTPPELSSETPQQTVTTNDSHASAAYAQLVHAVLRQYQTIADYKPEATQQSKISVSA